MKKLTILSIITLLLSFSTSAFSANDVVAGGETKTQKSSREIASALSAEEASLLAELEEELSMTVEEVVASYSLLPTKVVVHDINGKLIQELNDSEGVSDLSELPENATLLMTEGETQYYIVLQ